MCGLKTWVAAVARQVPEWLPALPDWNLPALNLHLPEWNLPNLAEWNFGNLPAWGMPALPAWVYPSHVRGCVRELVLYVWVVFITFLAVREDPAREQLTDEERPAGEVIVEGLEEVEAPSRDTKAILEEEEEEDAEEEAEEEEEDGWGLGKRGGLTRYPGFENLLDQPPTAAPQPAHRTTPLSLFPQPVSKEGDLKEKRKRGRER